MSLDMLLARREWLGPVFVYGNGGDCSMREGAGDARGASLGVLDQSFAATPLVVAGGGGRGDGFLSGIWAPSR